MVQKISFSAPIEIKAASGSAKLPSFEVVAYTGGPLQLKGFALPIVVDLEGMESGNSLIANLDHDPTLRVGHVTATKVVDGRLLLSGLASAATESRREVVESARQGFTWQASIEASVFGQLEEFRNSSVVINGRSFEEPVYVARRALLKGFAFVSHGADDNTQVSIAANKDTRSDDVYALGLARAARVNSVHEIEAIETMAYDAMRKGVKPKEFARVLSAALD